MLCLRYCDGFNFGSNIAIVPSVLPTNWYGPTWLIIDSCSDVQQNVGWEARFGGHLHGLLGFSTQSPGLDAGGLTQLANLLSGWNTAFNTWAAVAKADGGLGNLSYGMLIPDANQNDVIEARGGPHFGPDGSVNPTFYTCCDPNGGVQRNAVYKYPQPLNNLVNLTAETMNESYWYGQLGGNSLPNKTYVINSNVHVYQNTNGMVVHYLASGGVLYMAAMTRTARGFSISDAYNYALSWLNGNGGLPSDAALTFDGIAYSIPAHAAGTTASSTPIEYSFIWRHSASGLLGADSILVSVDDAGDYQEECANGDRNRCQKVLVWVPEYHVNFYKRLWRSVASTGQTIQRVAYFAPPSHSGITTQSKSSGPAPSAGYALCAPPIDSLSTAASPCDLYQQETDQQQAEYVYVSPTTGSVLGSTQTF